MFLNDFDKFIWQYSVEQIFSFLDKNIKFLNIDFALLVTFNTMIYIINFYDHFIQYYESDFFNKMMTNNINI